MMGGVLSTIAAVLALQAAPAPAPQTPPAVRTPTQVEVADGVVQIDDVVVTGQRLDEFIRDFVGEVARPSAYRGLARWKGDVCVGAVNMSGDHARYLIDRVSQVALQVGLTPGDPGCDPNIVVFATRDGEALARDLVETRGRIFQVGYVPELNAGRRGLEGFLAPGRPVRWWLTSVPTDARTGQIAVRVNEGAGDALAGAGLDFNLSGLPPPPILLGVGGSLIRQATRDDLTRAIVIIDVSRLDQTSFEQVADYVAMVSLVQIDPEADPSGFPTILNLFSQADADLTGLTEWDMTYLTSLYDVQLNQVARGAQVSSIASRMARQRRAADPSTD